MASLIDSNFITLANCSSLEEKEEEGERKRERERERERELHDGSFLGTMSYPRVVKLSP